MQVIFNSTPHGAVNADKAPLSAFAGHGLESIVNSSADMDNGVVFHLGAIVSTANEEVSAVVQPTTASIANTPLYLHHSGETNYYTGQTKTDFYLVKGLTGRARLMSVGETYTVTNNMIDNLPASPATPVGGYLSAQNGSLRLTWSAALPTGVRFIAEVINTRSLFYQSAIQFRVINA